MGDKFLAPRYRPDQLKELADLICTDHPGVTGPGGWCRLPAVVDGMRISSQYVSEHTSGRFKGFVEPWELKARVIRQYDIQDKTLRDSTYWSLVAKNNIGAHIEAERKCALEVLLCPFEDVPLHMSTTNTVAQHIVRWRLEHGV